MSTDRFALMGFRRMAKDPLQGGHITYGSAAPFEATLSAFELQAIGREGGGGFTPLLASTAAVAREDIGSIEFKSDEYVTATPLSGVARQCRIGKVFDMGVLVELTLIHENQGG